MIFKYFRKFAPLFIAASVLTSCGGSDNGSDEAEEEMEEDTVQHVTKVQKLFYTIPSPIEMSMLIKRAGAQYDKDLLNPVENVSKYTTATAQALNLGVYGADVSFASIMNQTQETMFYLSCAKKLADGLGITKAFDKETLEKIEANLENKDTLLALISGAYWESDAYLKENERANVSAFIIAGGWVEGLYIATELAGGKHKNKEIMARVAEQKYSLDNLIALLKTYKSDEGMAKIIGELEGLQKIYASIETTTETPSVKTDEETQITTIGSAGTISLSPEKLKEISDEVTKIRTRIINEQ